MAISKISSTSTSGSGTTASIVVPATAVLAGDLILLWLAVGDDVAPASAPSGFTAVCDAISNATGDDRYNRAYYKVAAGGEESDTLSWGLFATSENWVTGVLVMRGADAAIWDVTPVHATHHLTGANSATPKCVNITVGTAGSWVIEITTVTQTATGESSSDATATEWISQRKAGCNSLATYVSCAAGSHTGATHTYTGTSSPEYSTLILAIKEKLTTKPVTIGGVTGTATSTVSRGAKRSRSALAAGVAAVVVALGAIRGAETAAAGVGGATATPHALRASAVRSAGIGTVAVDLGSIVAPSVMDVAAAGTGFATASPHALRALLASADGVAGASVAPAAIRLATAQSVGLGATSATGSVVRVDSMGAGALGILASAWESATPVQRDIMRFIGGDILDLGQPARYRDLSANVWFVFDDHRFRASHIAYLGCFCANASDLPPDITLPEDKDEMRATLKAWIESPQRTHKLVRPGNIPGLADASNPWQTILDAQNTPSWMRMSPSVPDTLVPVEA